MSHEAGRLPGGRLGLRHGPIELAIGAEGAAEDVERAYRAAEACFPDILPRLVEELPLLRAPMGSSRPRAKGPVARRMVEATWPHRAVFVTPMAAVAGAVAEHVLDAMTGAARLDRVYVNNGGDIAIHLAPGQSIAVGVVDDIARPAMDATAKLTHASGARGIATSGWRGRSFSRGIADAVTVVAKAAADADAAATLIGNAVDTDHPAIRRRPARDLQIDSDLGAIPVTVAVGDLPEAAIEAALESGLAEARRLIDRGTILAAYLSLAGSRRAALSPGAFPAMIAA
ncbi:MAG: UPF0280 family protein [Alphaproteobacteria bacterium]|nr:UPF0280 family protein [Alphaproteobacteria bacterium]